MKLRYELNKKLKQFWDIAWYGTPKIWLIHLFSRKSMYEYTRMCKFNIQLNSWNNCSPRNKILRIYWFRFYLFWKSIKTSWKIIPGSWCEQLFILNSNNRTIVKLRLGRYQKMAHMGIRYFLQFGSQNTSMCRK